MCAILLMAFSYNLTKYVVDGQVGNSFNGKYTIRRVRINSYRVFYDVIDTKHLLSTIRECKFFKSIRSFKTVFCKDCSYSSIAMEICRIVGIDIREVSYINYMIWDAIHDIIDTVCSHLIF